MNSPIVNDVINMASGNLQEQAENTTGNLVNISADLPSQQDIPLAILNKASYIQYDNRDIKVTQKFIPDYLQGWEREQYILRANIQTPKPPEPTPIDPTPTPSSTTEVAIQKSKEGQRVLTQQEQERVDRQAPKFEAQAALNASTTPV